jgi:hypothetical protein
VPPAALCAIVTLVAALCPSSWPVTSPFRVDPLIAPTGATFGHWGVTARHSGKCLEIAGIGWRSVVQHTCQRGEPAQVWRRVDLAGGYFHLVAGRTGECLRASDITARAGWTSVDTRPCDSGLDQQWGDEDAGYGFFEVGDRQDRQCLDVMGASTADWTNVVLNRCRPERLSQQWHSALLGPTAWLHGYA